MVALLSPEDLSDFPGAPFPARLVEAASESVRADAGWHIAPQVTETVAVHGDGGRILILPSRRVVSVTEVRDVSGGSPVVLTGYRLAGGSVLYRDSGWPDGFAVLEVDMVHGFDTVPADLLPIVAARCKQASMDSTVTQESLGGRSVSFNVGRLASEVEGGPLSRYRLPVRFG
jgi:hypothetical protein